MSRLRYEVVADLVEECRNGKPVTPSRLHGIVFLLQSSHQLPLGYSFRLSDGPVSDGLRLDLQFLQQQGVISYTSDAVARNSRARSSSSSERLDQQEYKSALQLLLDADDELLGLAGTFAAYHSVGMMERTIIGRIEQATYFPVARLNEAKALLKRLQRTTSGPESIGKHKARSAAKHAD